MVAALAVALWETPEFRGWLEANRHSIAHVTPARERRRQERVFAQTLVALKVQEHLRPLDAPNAQPLARQIVSNGRIFHFESVQPTPPKTWWDRLRGWVWERWQAMLRALFGKHRLGGTASIAVADMVLVLSILAFLWVLVRILWHYGRVETQLWEAADLPAGDNPAKLCARADEEASLGRYANAVAHLFAATLAVLRRRGVLSTDESETIGQLRRRVRTAIPASVSSFEALSAALTLAVYADAPLHAADWERARSAYTDVVGGGGTHAA
ncbi:MAG: hypothetical protein NVS9B12_09060 [Vulcanimicrobiaceae bacterium]